MIMAWSMSGFSSASFVNLTWQVPEISTNLEGVEGSVVMGRTKAPFSFLAEVREKFRLVTPTPFVVGEEGQFRATKFIVAVQQPVSAPSRR